MPRNRVSAALNQQFFHENISLQPPAPIENQVMRVPVRPEINN